MSERLATRRSDADSPKHRLARALKLSQLFDKVSRPTRERALASAELLTLPADTVVFEQGSDADAIFIVGRGRTRVERTMPDGRLVPLGYRGTGDVLGEAALGAATRNLEAVIAMEPIELARLPAARMLELFVADPGMSAPVLGLLLARHRENEDRIESLLFHGVESRIANFLVLAADRWGVPTPRGVLISAPITHLEIAQAIGSTRETVTLTLGALRRRGFVDVAGRRLIVADREALAGC